MARKTVDVAYVREKVNDLLKHENVSDDFRQGAISVLESILHHTGNYNGYIYLSWVEKEGRERSGVEQWRYDNALQGVDTACMSYSSRLEKQELPIVPYLGNLTRRVYY